MEGKITFNNARGKLRAIRIILETDQGVYEDGMPLTGDLANVTQVGFVIFKPGPAKDVDDVRRKVQENLLRGGRKWRADSYYGKG